MYTRSTIAVGNIVVGVYNFIILGHPLTWKIIPLPSASESFSFTRQGEVKWVRRGVAEHGVKTPNGTIGLKISVWPGKKKTEEFKELKNATMKGITRLGGHEALVFSHVDKKLFRKIRVLSILSYCDVTDRTLLIQFLEGGEWMEEVIPHLEGSQCHLEG